MARTITLKRDAAVEWTPRVPNCCRCGEARWQTFYTKLDEAWAWVGDCCLTDDEKRRWIRPEEEQRGKVSIPMVGK